MILVQFLGESRVFPGELPDFFAPFLWENHPLGIRSASAIAGSSSAVLQAMASNAMQQGSGRPLGVFFAKNERFTFGVMGIDIYIYIWGYVYEYVPYIIHANSDIYLSIYIYIYMGIWLICG